MAVCTHLASLDFTECLCVAGADTTVSAQYAFFLAMVRHPGEFFFFVDLLKILSIYPLEVLKKAQKEIDTVIGNDRLPGFSDREHLPYVNALMTETLRWNSVAPTGSPFFLFAFTIN